MGKQYRFSGVSAVALTLAMCAPAMAFAQAAEQSVDEIVVTGSRIATTGYRQPTPVTVVSEVQLQRDAKVSIGDTIRELPSVGSSGSPNNGVGANNIVGGVTGLDTVNLRQLGTNRTLVLLDSQRVVASNITGVVDLGTMPTMLVQRVDVVTGGASAAWGSDAVSGVVNLVLNKKFDGLRVSAEYGDSWLADHKSYRLQAAGGIGFAGDRGRIIGAVNWLNSPDAIFANGRKWNTYTNLINNPGFAAGNGQPRLIHRSNTGLSQATNGGLIQGPACLVAVVAGVCARPNPLINTRFVGPNATPTPFNPGLVAAANSVGGDGEVFYPATNNLAVVFKTLNLFNYTDYQITDNLKASVQLNYGESRSRNNSTPMIRFGNLAIQRDNAYLPASIAAQMTTLGLNSINLGVSNINNVKFDEYSYDNFVENGVGIPVSVQTRTLKRGVFSLDGKLGGDWTWNAYAQKARVRLRVETQSNVVTARYNFAVDAVRNAAGQIVCRATQAGNAAAAGCVPLNVFGEGVASKEAIRYVNVKPGENWETITLDQEVAAASATGSLPFGLPAGNISVAFGGELRREKGETVVDPGAAARAYAFANFSAFAGKYDVKEAFAEVDVPLIEDGFVESLGLNAAGRITDYSTSGTVETWKLGLTSQVNGLIRLRGTASRDIRAPNLQELFSGGQPLASNAVDPKTGQNVSIFQTTSGNANLKPEKADTISGGVVLTPTNNLSLSLDYYSIDVKDAIQSVNSTVVLARCNAGETAFCSQLDFNGPGGVLSQIRVFPLNLSVVKTSGLDFQLDYGMDLGEGRLATKLVSNYIINQSQVALGVKTTYDGALGGDSPVQGVPKLRATLSETYSQGKFSGTIQARFIGKAKLVNSWTGVDVDDNNVPMLAYTDLRASYQMTEKAQIFGAIDNVWNLDPPNIPVSQNNTASIFSTAVRGDIYDTIGRSYRVGIRVNF